MNRSFAPAILLSVVLAITSGCGTGPAPTPPVSPAASPSAAPSSPNPSINLPITTPDAAALVIASDPRFAGLKPEDRNLIGQCCFYAATPTGSGFAVMIEIGWGDCPAGCVDRHDWFYSVAPDGTVHLDREDGAPVPAGVPGASGGTTSGVIGISGIATAGPVCPVARPGDPACADRPVVGAMVHVIDATGTEVATLETDAKGAFIVTVPPGRYRLVPDPVPGLIGTAVPMEVIIGSTLASVQLRYDTGIR